MLVGTSKACAPCPRRERMTRKTNGPRAAAMLREFFIMFTGCMFSYDSFAVSRGIESEKEIRSMAIAVAFDF